MDFLTSIQLLYLKYKRRDLLDLLPGPSAKITLSVNVRRQPSQNRISIDRLVYGTLSLQVQNIFQ